MEDDQEQRPESLLPYEDWIEKALRQVVAQAVTHVSATGLPGDHHFYITFRTDYPGTIIPQRLSAQYPQEMTIVLQHQFWDLRYDPDTRSVNVGLSFGGVPTTLIIPLDAIVSFADPAVRYGLRFRHVVPEPDPAEAELEESGEVTHEEPPAPPETPPQPQVVSLDAFRRRTPPKN